MLDRIIIHDKLGEGRVVGFENGILTVQFADRTSRFRYPDALAGPMRFADEELQREAESLARESIAEQQETRRRIEEEKAAQLRRGWARAMSSGRKKRPLSRQEQMYREQGNLAFKCNFCDGGCSDSCIGFKGVCSPETIVYNIEKKQRKWCSSEGSPCSRYHKGELTYDQLSAMNEDQFVCYEARMLNEWIANAGEDINDDGTHKARRLMNAKSNSLAVLTTILPGSTERIIFAAFITDRVDEGDEVNSGYVKADPEYTIELTPNEATQVKFWDYYKNSDSSKRWGSRLIRYLSNDICTKILERIVEITTDDKKEQAKRILARFHHLKG